MSSQIEIISRGVMIHSNRILLCRNVKNAYHFLPGGHVEFGEPASAALAREFMEECGLPVVVRDLLLTHEHIYARKSGPRHEVNLVFHVEHLEVSTSGARVRVESKEPKIEFDWIALSELDKIELRPTTMRQWLVERSVKWISDR
jgi:8-oxo-dGTP diphosphatase